MSKGFTLVEMLVTLLIISVALVGMASVQMRNLKSVNESEFQSLATLYAFEMAERMRANRVAIRDGFYDAISGNETLPKCLDGCTPQQLAEQDAAEWNQAIRSPVAEGGLPGSPKGVVQALSDQQGFLISVIWQSSEKTEQYDLEVNL